MRQLSYRPSITVTIGRYTREYRAYVTTAPAELDLPKTVTLQEGPFSEVVGLAADPITYHELRARTPARLVLIETRQEDWQEARYREQQHLILPADPGLVGFNALQLWLWQRLQRPAANPEAA